MHEEGTSIWFFIGISLAVNGLLIFGAGVYEVFSPPPPEHRVVLFDLRASLWWGAILAIAGFLYLWKYKPIRKRQAEKVLVGSVD